MPAPIDDVKDQILVTVPATKSDDQMAEAGALSEPHIVPQRRVIRVKKYLKPLLLFTVGVIIAAGVGFIYLRQDIALNAMVGRNSLVSQTMTSLGFVVDEILIEGRHRSSPESIVAAVNSESWHGQSIVNYNASAVREKLLALPWISSADIEVRLPRTLSIRVVEREPLALWQVQRKYHLIDRSGEIIPVEDLGGFSRLPVVIGEAAPKAAESLLVLLASEPDLARRVSYATRVGDRRWNIQIDGDIEVRLPEENEAIAWSKLAQIEREQGVLKRDVSVIDLRLSDRMIVQLAASPGSPVPAARQRGTRG